MTDKESLPTEVDSSKRKREDDVPEVAPKKKFDSSAKQAAGIARSVAPDKSAIRAEVHSFMYYSTRVIWMQPRLSSFCRSIIKMGEFIRTRHNVTKAKGDTSFDQLLLGAALYNLAHYIDEGAKLLIGSGRVTPFVPVPLPLCVADLVSAYLPDDSAKITLAVHPVWLNQQLDQIFHQAGIPDLSSDVMSYSDYLLYCDIVRKRANRDIFTARSTLKSLLRSGCLLEDEEDFDTSDEAIVVAPAVYSRREELVAGLTRMNQYEKKRSKGVNVYLPCVEDFSSIGFMIHYVCGSRPISRNDAMIEFVQTSL